MTDAMKSGIGVGNMTGVGRNLDRGRGMTTPEKGRGTETAGWRMRRDEVMTGSEESEIRRESDSGQGRGKMTEKGGLAGGTKTESDSSMSGPDSAKKIGGMVAIECAKWNLSANGYQGCRGRLRVA